MPTFITEPAVGYGVALSALYFHSSYSAKKGPPSISGIFGALTQNGTWAGGILHAGFWKNDHIRYLGALARTYVNLGFYGSGNLGLTDIESVNLNLDAGCWCSGSNSGWAKPICSLADSIYCLTPITLLRYRSIYLISLVMNSAQRLAKCH